MINNLVFKKHFFFGNLKNFKKKKVAILVVNRVNSNIFITLMDQNKKVIVCKSSGSCFVGKKKKQKTNYQALELIVPALVVYLKLYSVEHLQLFLKVKVNFHVHTLLKELSLNNIKIISFHDRIRLPHNG